MIFNIYARKSVCTDEGESIESQISICKEYIERNFFSVSDHQVFVYKDEGFSGKDTKRPQYQEMMKAIKKEKNGYIVCYKLDRITRSVSDFSNLIDRLAKQNISFISVREHFDTSTPAGRSMMYMCVVFAQMERESIAERVRDNMLFLAKSGRWLGGTAPTGFNAVRTSERMLLDGQLKKISFLELNEDIEKIKLIYKKHLELGSTIEVARFLKNQNIKTTIGNDFTHSTVSLILHNPIYCTADKDSFDYFSKKTKNIFFTPKDFYKKRGLIAYNRTKLSCSNPISSWIIALGRHKGVISGKDWVQVQNILFQPSTDSRNRKTEALFSKMISCRKCGRPLTLRGTNSGNFSYVCTYKKNFGSKYCDSKNLNGISTDKLILQELFKLDVKEIKSKIHIKKNAHTYNKLDDQIFNNKAQIEKLEKAKQKYIYHLQKITPQSPLIKDIEINVARINSEIKKLTSETYDLETKLQATKNERVDLDYIVNAFIKLKSNFDTLNFATKKSLIKLIVKKIIWSDEKLVIVYNGVQN